MSYLEELDRDMRKEDPAYDQARAVDSFISELTKSRKEKGLTQAQVAKAAGIRQSHVSRIENFESDMVTFSTILRYAKAIGMSLKLEEGSGLTGGNLLGKSRSA